MSHFFLGLKWWEIFEARNFKLGVNVNRVLFFVCFEARKFNLSWCMLSIGMMRVAFPILWFYFFGELVFI